MPAPNSKYQGAKQVLIKRGRFLSDQNMLLTAAEPNRQDRLDSEAYLSRNAAGARVPGVMHDSLRAEHQRPKVHTQSETRVVDVTSFGTGCLADGN